MFSDYGSQGRGCKLRPLVNADPFILANRGYETLFKCQVSGLREKRDDQ